MFSRKSSSRGVSFTFDRRGRPRAALPRRAFAPRGPSYGSASPSPAAWRVAFGPRRSSQEGGEGVPSRRAPAGASSRSERAPRFSAFLIQLSIEVESLQDELDRRSHGRGVAGRAEFRDGALHPGDLQRLLHVLAG